ncbi:MAG: mechanosensitive ion channel, partial [Candidatus Omnitrophica bacterium]|nr:mechanosensitive ion channel [Candidatus Omnitrophota bacterium]
FISSLVFAQENQPPQNLKDVAKDQIDTVKNLIDLITEFIVKYSFQVLGGIVVLVLGWLLARFLAKLVGNFLSSQKNIDVTVAKFSISTVKLLVMTFAVIVALGKFGIEIAPLIAGISVAGFGLSFAFQGPLSNYVAGAVLIFTKPFKVGDIIEVAGVMGKVLDLKLPRTELKTVDGNMIIVPNKHIVGEIIHNYSVTKKLELTVGISYSADVDKALEVVQGIVRKDERIKKASIGISEFADSSINIYARLWCPHEDYWDVMFSTNKAIHDEFKKNGIEIPFPQRDVHIINKD